MITADRHRGVRFALALALALLASPLLAVPPAQAAAPTVLAFLPLSGAVGTSVTITGSGFSDASPATGVAFNGTPATFTVGSDLTISTTVPAGATTGAIAVTDAEGTSSSLLAFTVSAGTSPVPTTVAAFLPASGSTGTSVTITGTGLSGATSVAFDGTPATFTPGSDLHLTATVPAGATDGPISVVTPGGSATSVLSFRVTGHAAVVRHARHLTLRLRKGRATGKLSATDGFAGCQAHAVVRIQRRGRRHAWTAVGHAKTNADGRFAIRLRRPGTYRALAPERKLNGTDVCARSVSPRRRR